MTLELGQREKETSREEEREEKVGVVVGLGKWAREIHISLLGWQTGRLADASTTVPWFLPWRNQRQGTRPSHPSCDIQDVLTALGSFSL